MAQAVLERVLQDLESLEPKELEQLGQVIRTRLNPDEAAQRQMAFHEALLAAGLVRQIRSPRPGPHASRCLAEVQGSPVSETVIEDRR